MKNTITTKKRDKSGHFAAELPGVLFLLFFLFVFPLMNLGTVCLRYTLLASAARDGAHAAAAAFTFETGSPGKPAAIAAGPAAVNTLADKYNGINISSVDVDILATDISTQAVTRHTDKLTNPANTQTTIYSIETIVTGSLEPLMPYTAAWFGNVPGLTGPAVITVRAKEYAENPQGLDD